MVVISHPDEMRQVAAHVAVLRVLEVLHLHLAQREVHVREALCDQDT